MTTADVAGSRHKKVESDVIFSNFSNLSRMNSSGRSRQHGAEKSGSTVVILFHFIGLDYHFVTFQVLQQKKGILRQLYDVANLKACKVLVKSNGMEQDHDR